MPRPIVEIHQEILNAVFTPADPTQPTCIVGPAYYVRPYTAAVAVVGDAQAYDPHASHSGLPVDGNADASILYKGTDENVDLVGVPPVVYLEDVRTYVYHDDTMSINDNQAGVNAMTTDSNAAIQAGDKVRIWPNAVKSVLKVPSTEHDFVALGVRAWAHTCDSAGDGGDLRIFKVETKDGFSKLWLEGAHVDAAGFTIKDAAGNATLTVPAGDDTYSIAEEPPPQDFTVVATAGGGVTQVAESITFKIVDSTAKCRVTRASGNTTLAADFQAAADSLTLGQESGAATLVRVPGTTGVSGIIVSATVHLAFRALITTKSGSIASVTDAASIEATYGPIVSDNPLGMALFVAVSNAQRSIKALAIGSDDVTGFSNALTVINTDPDVYAIVPLSSDLSGVLAPYKASAITMSSPKNGKYRVVIGSTEEIPLHSDIVGSKGAPGTDGFINNGDLKNFRDNSGGFSSAGIVKGDLVVKSNGTALGTVEAVLSDTLIELQADGVAAEGLSYIIQRSIAGNQDLQAASLAARVKSASDKRLIITFPAKCTVQDGAGNEVANQPGYYLSAALGGLMALTSEFPHRPLNQVGVAGVTDVVESNSYFNDTQIDKISDGGYFVFVQDNGGLPYCVHQLTSGTVQWPGVQEYAELSVVRNFDFVSRFLKKRLEPFVGVWNVVPQAIGSIKTTLNAGLQHLENKSADRIGPCLLEGKVDFVRKSAVDSGTLEGKVTVQLPKVLNKLVINLLSE